MVEYSLVILIEKFYCLRLWILSYELHKGRDCVCLSVQYVPVTGTGLINECSILTELKEEKVVLLLPITCLIRRQS